MYAIFLFVQKEGQKEDNSHSSQKEKEVSIYLCPTTLLL